MKKFGLQIYSIRDHFTTEEDTAASFAKMKEYGYTQAQTAGTYSYISPEKFRALADENGIEIVGTHYDWNLICNDMEGTIAYHRTLGTTNIGIGGMPGEARGTKEGLFAFIDKFNEMAKIYGEHGFKLTYHNHSFEFVKLEDGKTLFDHLIEKFDPVNAGFVIDVCWLHLGGADIYDILERLEGRIVMLHLKDVAACRPIKTEGGGVIGHLPERIEVGCGNINFARIIPAAEKIGCHLFVVEDEIYSTGESYDSVRISAENIIAKFLEK